MIREQKANVNTLDIASVHSTQIGKEKWERRTEKMVIPNKLFVIKGKRILPKVTKGIRILSKVA